MPGPFLRSRLGGRLVLRLRFRLGRLFFLCLGRLVLRLCFRLRNLVDVSFFQGVDILLHGGDFFQQFDDLLHDLLLGLFVIEAAHRHEFHQTGRFVLEAVHVLHQFGGCAGGPDRAVLHRGTDRTVFPEFDGVDARFRQVGRSRDGGDILPAALVLARSPGALPAGTAGAAGSGRRSVPAFDDVLDDVGACRRDRRRDLRLFQECGSEEVCHVAERRLQRALRRAVEQIHGDAEHHAHRSRGSGRKFVAAVRRVVQNLLHRADDPRGHCGVVGACRRLVGLFGLFVAHVVTPVFDL